MMILQASLAIGMAAQAAPEPRPNIILIMTDQQTAEAMSCAGNPWLHTPNMDRIADAGVRFTNAYCTAPLSGPSRAALMTGLYPEGIGMMRNGTSLPEEWRDRTLGQRFRKAGYACAYAGKWHVGPELDAPEWSGFEQIHPHRDPDLGEAVARWLAQPHPEPFFLVASLVNPHNICEWARGQNLPTGNIEPPKRKDLPPLPKNFRRNADEPDVLLAEQAANYPLYPTARFSRTDWRAYRHAYFRLVERADEQIGLILDQMDARGLWDNTLLIFTSDHGDGTGAHRWNQKSALYEEVTAVPLIISLPDRLHGGETRGQLANTGIDLYATLCDWSGLPPDGDGTSLRDVIENNTPGQPYIVTETLFDRGTTRGWMLRTPSHKYILYDKGKNREQFFDISRDPGERRNLAARPAFAPILQSCRDLLAAWFESHNVRSTRPGISDIPGKTSGDSK